MVSERLKNFFGRWLISITAVLVAEQVVPGISCENWIDLIIAALVLGLLNIFIKPLLMFFSLPFLIITLGLFTLVINAVLLIIVSYLVKEFHVDGFGAAFWGALVISIVTIILNFFTGMSSTQFKVHGFKEKRRGGDDDSDNHVIDV